MSIKLCLLKKVSMVLIVVFASHQFSYNAFRDVDKEE